MTVIDLAYGVAAALTLAAAVGVWVGGRPVLSGYLLSATMTGLAIIFWELKSPTLAGLQLLVYGGGVLVMVLFIVMFTASGAARPPIGGPWRLTWLIPPAAGVSAGLTYPHRAPEIFGRALGRWLLLRQGMALEAVALLLLTALVAAIAIVAAAPQKETQP